MRTRFKYLLKFELFPPQPLLGGGGERDRQGRKELVFPSNPTTSCLLTLKECCIQRNKLALLKSVRIFLKSETLKALKP